MPIELTLDGIDTENVDSGIVDVPGFYRVTIDDTMVDKNNSNNDVFDCIVTHGGFKGCKIKAFLANAEAADSDKQEQAVRRTLSYAKRLGLTTEEKIAAAKSVGKISLPDWTDAIGWEGWIELVPNSSANSKYKAQAAYIPFYPLDHERVPVELRKAAGVKVSESELAAAAAAPSNGKGSGRKKKGAEGGDTAPKPAANNADFSDI